MEDKKFIDADKFIDFLRERMKVSYDSRFYNHASIIEYFIRLLDRFVKGEVNSDGNKD